MNSHLDESQWSTNSHYATETNTSQNIGRHLSRMAFDSVNVWRRRTTRTKALIGSSLRTFPLCEFLFVGYLDAKVLSFHIPENLLVMGVALSTLSSSVPLFVIYCSKKAWQNVSQTAHLRDL